MLPTEIQVTARRAHATCVELTELARICSMGPLDPQAPNVAVVMANAGQAMIEPAREAEFDSARLLALADAHVLALRHLYQHTITVVDLMRIFGAAMKPDAVDDVMRTLGAMQAEMEAFFPGEGIPTGD